MLRCGIDMIEHQRVEDGIARQGDRFLVPKHSSGPESQCVLAFLGVSGVHVSGPEEPVERV